MRVSQAENRKRQGIFESIRILIQQSLQSIQVFQNEASSRSSNFTFTKKMEKTLANNLVKVLPNTDRQNGGIVAVKELFQVFLIVHSCQNVSNWSILIKNMIKMTSGKIRKI